MVVINRLWKLIYIIFEIISVITASTHWIVTENGRIQSQLDSPFYLRRPYDLLALLDQETRRTNINNLYEDLVGRKNSIDTKWSSLEGASDLESRFYTTDSDCLSAGKLLSDIDLYTSIGTNGSDRVNAFETDNEKAKTDFDEFSDPECEKFSQIDFSMSAYEHLQAMLDRFNISLQPEHKLESLMPVKSVKLFGREIFIGLKKNSTSWLYYNLGSLYWRIKGNAGKAIECSRRALYYVPRQYRDIPLLNLAGIFHQTQYSKDAAIILHAAVDHAPQQPVNYYALGNVYAVLGDYNKSVACYDNLIKLQPNFEEVVTTKHAMLCHRKLETGLLELHESLQGILTDLHDYHSQQQQWLRLQERLMWEQAPFEVQLAGLNAEKISAIVTKKSQRCMQRSADDSKPTISCDFMENQLATNLQVDITLNLQRLLRNVESETQKISEQMKKNKLDAKVDNNDNKIVMSEDKMPMPPMLHPKYPTTTPTTTDKYFDETGWPSKAECLAWNLPLNVQEEIDLPVFMPPENKGFQVSKMLSDYIGLPYGSEHELPWYPPICEHPIADNDITYLPSAVRRVINNPLKVNDLLLQHLLSYVNDGKAEEAEIGQRIITAMHKKSGPSWVLTTLASLYWRIRSNPQNALNCLDLAFQAASKEYSDAILVSIGSILHQLGLVDDAIKFATLAFKINYVEPSTNFLLALLHYSKNNPILAMYYMKNVLRVDPDYYSGKAEMLLKTWACKIKVGSYEDVKSTEKTTEDMCAERESINGEGVVCTANGEQCKTAAIQCFRAETSAEDRELASGTRPLKLLNAQQCTSKHKVGLGHSLITSLLSAERVADDDFDDLSDNDPQQAYHMRISLGDEKTPSGSNSLGDFYVSVSTNEEALLHVFDKTGTYSLSAPVCKEIKDAEWLSFTSLWQSIAARNVDIAPFLKPLPKSLKDDTKPYCSQAIPSSPATLDHLTAMILRNRLPSSPEVSLSEMLGLMAGDQQASLSELGAKIGIALQENSTSWILATAAAFYWRVFGNTEEAVTCLRQALTYVPNDMKDIPLISLSNILHRIGFLSDALEVAYIALKSHPEFVVNHFTLGNIHTSMGDLERAISFYRSSLALDANFVPARNRLQAILCTLLFDDSGSIRDNSEVAED